MRFLPSRLHGFIDYLWGLALLATPWIFGFADGGAAQILAFVFGIGAIFYSLITDYELGVIRLLPMPLHLGLDGLGGAFLAASPWLFGLFSVVASLITRTDPMQPSGLRHG